jgi:hypothetical protein
VSSLATISRILASHRRPAGKQHLRQPENVAQLLSWRIVLKRQGFSVACLAFSLPPRSRAALYGGAGTSAAMTGKASGD